MCHYRFSCAGKPPPLQELHNWQVSCVRPVTYNDHFNPAFQILTSARTTRKAIILSKLPRNLITVQTHCSECTEKREACSSI